MKSASFFIFVLLIVGCNSNQNSAPIKEEKPPSRILSEELKEILPELIKVQNLTFQEEMASRNYDRNNLFVEILNTDKNLYIRISVMDCESQPYFLFTDKTDSFNLSFRINSNSVNIERFFNLKGLKRVDRNYQDVAVCHDWYFVDAKLSQLNGKLKLEKISTFYDNSHRETFYDKTDSIFMKNISFYFPEPEPPADFKQ